LPTPGGLALGLPGIDGVNVALREDGVEKIHSRTVFELARFDALLHSERHLAVHCREESDPALCAARVVDYAIEVGQDLINLWSSH
jgi:hypothetical protein